MGQSDVSGVHRTWEEIEVFRQWSDPIALTKAPRGVRVAAAPYFEKLAIAITKRIRKHVQGVRDAKNAFDDAAPETAQPKKK